MWSSATTGSHMAPMERLLVEKELYLAVLSSDRLVQVLLVMKTK